MPNLNGLRIKVCRVRYASPTLHVFLLLNYDICMRASLPLRKRAAPTRFDKYEQKFESTREGYGMKRGGYIYCRSLGAEE